MIPARKALASRRTLATVAFFLVLSAASWADTLQVVTSAAAQAANDSVGWAQLGADQTNLSATFSVNSAQAQAVSVTLSGSNSVVSVVCSGTPSACSWTGNGFTAGDSLLWASDAINGGNGPITLSFTSGISGGGALVQANIPGGFTAEIQAFNGATSLGSFTLPSNGSGDALYIGVQDQTGPNITKLVFSLTVCGADDVSGCSDFGIDTVGLNTPAGKSASTTGLASSANPSVFGQPVTLTTTVTPATATGTVTFLDGATNIGTKTLSGGVATLIISNFAFGGHSLTASYGGDTNFTASTSITLSQTVNKDATVVAEGSSTPNPSVFGQPVTFSATVSAAAPGAGTPTGTVSFKEGAATLAQGTLSGGAASAIDSSLAVGTHSVIANYGGDGNFNGGVSTAVSHTVNKANTTTALVSSLNPSTASQLVTFTATVATVAPGAGTPTGTVTFFSGASNIGTGNLSGGVATLAISTLPVGTDSITAAYGSDSNFNGSTSNTVSQIVNSATGPTADLSITQIQHTPTHPVAFGGTLTETITVSNAGPNDATTTTLTVNLSGNFLVKSLSPTGECTGTTTITCNLGPLTAGGQPATVTITLTPLLGRMISLDATVTSDLPDNVPINNAASDQLKVVLLPQAR